MPNATAATKDSLFSFQHLQNFYIPAGVLVFGTALLSRDYVPYVALAALIFGGFQVLKDHGPRKVLRADKWQGFKLVEATELSHNTGIYKFALSRSTDVLGLPIGQHIQFSAKINGVDVVRSYTPISSDETDRGSFSMLIKSYPAGNISKHIASLKIGQSIQTRGPKGQFVYQSGLVRAFGMVAGGTGLAPMLQIIKAIIRNPEDKTEVGFIFANVNMEDILLKDELDELAGRHSNFRIHYVLNNPPEGWKGGVGFVTEDMIKKICPAPAADIKILLCGPPPMISAMKKATAALEYEPAKPVSKLPDQVFSF
ncbi:hypothetical protein HOY80DRAFT_1038258 [Tuber brumale]|nr:hypothetical protein HOY80DRAFT_1038258 [Tuber brumale]